MLFAAAGESSGSYRSEFGRRRYLKCLEINALIVGGRLQVNWGYSRQVHRRGDDRTAGSGVCAEPGGDQSSTDRWRTEDAVRVYTPSDFPLRGRVAGGRDEGSGGRGAERESGKGHVGIEDVYPLSPLQEGLLFHSLYAPQGRAVAWSRCKETCSRERWKLGALRRSMGASAGSGTAACAAAIAREEVRAAAAGRAEQSGFPLDGDDGGL